MTNKVAERRIGTAFVLIVYCIFAVSVLFVLMLGADTYQKMTAVSRDWQNERTAISYIWSKVKNSDNAGGVFVGHFNEMPALFIEEVVNGVVYHNVVYHYDGWAYELFFEAGLDFAPKDGVALIRLDELSFEDLGHGLIYVRSGPWHVSISPRCAPGKGLEELHNE